MINHLKIKRIFGPIAIVIISLIVMTMLSKLPAEPHYQWIMSTSFFALFLYWISAVVITFHGFKKSRQKLNGSDKS